MSNYWRGHEIEFVNDQWVYSVNKKPVKENPSIYCGHCGRSPTIEGHDGCLGTIPGIKNACCGHGITDQAYVQFFDDIRISGEEALDFFRRNNEIQLQKND